MHAELARWVRGVLVLGAALSAAVTVEGQTPARNYYGAKFEPVDGILHGAGQTYYRDTPDGPISHSFNNYAGVTGADLYPLLYMDYTSWNSGSGFYDGLRSRIEDIEANDNRMVVPQLGLVLPQGTQVLTQQQVDEIVDGLRSLNRQVYFRPGYEANGPWNNYEAETFKTNFQMISDAVRAEDLPVAMVWNVVVGDGGAWSAYNNVDDYYPGDDYVDWWSMNVFGVVTFNVPFWVSQVNTFLNAADQSGKPVMIGEATPQFTGAEDEADWDAWFAKFFDRIKSNPGVKAHTYINWDWGATDPADNWTDWLDARLETAHPTVRANYLAEIGDAAFLHAAATLPEFFRESLGGDYNGDGVVNAADFTAWREAEGQEGLVPFSGADGNGDGRVDDADRLIWEAAHGATESGSAVPEPSAGAAATAAGLILGAHGHMNRRRPPRDE